MTNQTIDLYSSAIITTALIGTRSIVAKVENNLFQEAYTKHVH